MNNKTIDINLDFPFIISIVLQKWRTWCDFPKEESILFGRINNS